MGFFSSRKADHLETNLPADENAVIRVIRSKFYGKGKGKERDTDGRSVFYSISSPSLSSRYIHSGEKQSFTPARRSRAPISPQEPPLIGTSSSTTLTQYAEITVEPSGNRASADALTITLAQRLNELATANSEGLLSDDEYRLLRQNLFERFASGSPVPIEAPLVPLSGIGHVNGDNRTSLSSTHDRQLSSSCHVQSSRASSVQSRKSMSSSITSMLRRTASKRAAPIPSEFGSSDTGSVFSNGSSIERGSILPRSLSNPTNDRFTRDDRSRSQYFHPLGTSMSEYSGSSVRSVSRRRKRSGSSAPPSSFPGIPPSNSYDGHAQLTNPLPNDDDVVSAKDLRRHVELVEAEGRRLLDGFNGLELSTLTRRQRRPLSRPPLPLSAPLDAALMNTPDRRSLSLQSGGDVDAMSYTSGGSGRTNISAKRSASSPRKIPISAPNSTLVVQPRAMSRKGSVSSMSSRGRTGMGGPSSLSNLSGPFTSSSSINLTKSSGHLPLATVNEAESPFHGHHASETVDSLLTGTTPSDGVSRAGSSRSGKARGPADIEDEEIRAMEVELGDIRRRKAEVTARYEARLEYLRARLKGAELREKVMRK
ncbi:uncharacterized protein LAESUDRAFT_719929 [Laetiporus sulphureus 93-53]|uniref:Uncharacterized protein n=1 Tax=Laetiporus sulphureus 93-53 TaxID=1314785 RepID=A0A165HNN6_9APHY|nr:uncharacterized protein LAESUDRAFT_719929 [Laetiporus sulphureus 93-53]KZT11977.1 hypothetical protein LAESUDRAFT_719929 [Laetiporus sulphureus 93-53]